MNIPYCNKCDLCLTRKSIVNGHGNIHAELMFIGEAPGYTEDKYGIPFTGKAGSMLNTYLKLFGFDRVNDTYITTIIKCKPPNNRPPHDFEIANCKPYLMQELVQVNPRIIILLGNTAMQSILGITGITKIRGKWINVGQKWIMSMFHPSYLLDMSRSNERVLTYYDFSRVVDKYRELVNFRHNL